MSIAFRSVANGLISNTVSPAITAPAGLTDGDLIIVHIATNSTETVNTVLAGWTQMGTTQDQSSDSSMFILYKIASSEGASWTFTNLFNANEFGVYASFAYSGVDGTSPLDVAVVQGDLGNVTTAGASTGSIMPTSANCMVFSMYGGDPGAKTRTATAEYTERTDYTGTTTYGWVYAQEHIQGAAAAETHKITPNETEGICYMIMAIRPSGGVAAGGAFSPLAGPLGGRLAGMID